MKRLAIVFPLALAACVSRPVVDVPLASCASLIPSGWKAGVSGEPIPDTGKTDLDAAKAYAQAFVGQTGKLEIANGRTADAISIIEKCEALANASRVDRR